MSVNWLRYGNWMGKMTFHFDGTSQVSSSRTQVLPVTKIKEYFISLFN